MEDDIQQEEETTASSQRIRDARVIFPPPQRNKSSPSLHTNKHTYVRHLTHPLSLTRARTHTHTHTHAHTHAHTHTRTHPHHTHIHIHTHTNSLTQSLTQPNHFLPIHVYTKNPSLSLSLTLRSSRLRPEGPPGTGHSVHKDGYTPLSFSMTSRANRSSLVGQDRTGRCRAWYTVDGNVLCRKGCFKETDSRQTRQRK